MASNNEKIFSLNESKNIKNKNTFFDRIFDFFSREDVIVKSLFIVGIFSIVMGAVSMYVGIKNSFVSSKVVLDDKASMIEALNRNKDTDGDGISDYDELNTYKTSPYLLDSDLDGVSDYDQMILGVACTGINCKTNTSTTTPPSSESAFVDLLKGLDFQNMNFDVFKNTLLASGYSKESVDSLTEQDFNDMKQALSSDASSSKETEITAEDKAAIEQMRNLTPAEIRQFLIDGGATEEELSQFTDEQLKQIYLQTLDEVSSSQ